MNNFILEAARRKIEKMGQTPRLDQLTDPKEDGDTVYMRKTPELAKKIQKKLDLPVDHDINTSDHWGQPIPPSFSSPLDDEFPHVKKIEAARHLKQLLSKSQEYIKKKQLARTQFPEIPRNPNRDNPNIELDDQPMVADRRTYKNKELNNISTKPLGRAIPGNQHSLLKNRPKSNPPEPSKDPMSGWKPPNRTTIFGLLPVNLPTEYIKSTPTQKTPLKPSGGLETYFGGEFKKTKGMSRTLQKNEPKKFDNYPPKEEITPNDKMKGGLNTVGKYMFPKGYKPKTLKEFVMEAVVPPNHNGFDQNKSNQLRNRNANINAPLYRAKNALAGGINGIRQALSPTRNILPTKPTVGTGNIMAGREYTNKKTDIYSGNDPSYYDEDKINARINTAQAPNSYNGVNNNLMNGRVYDDKNAKKKQFEREFRASRESDKQTYQQIIKPAIKRTTRSISKKIASRDYWNKDIKPGLNTIANAFRR